LSDLPVTEDRFRFRFYENKYPEIDDLVMVTVKEIADMGAYVTLLEYEGVEGMILLSELSRRRIRSIAKLIRVGRTECVLVLRVDTEKGYIDLSKRRVSPEDIAACEERYQKSKQVHTILRNVAEKTELPIEKVYEMVAWPLAKKYGHALDAFRLAVADPEEIFNDELVLEPAVKDLLLSIIQRKLTPSPFRMRVEIEVSCFREAGVEAVKAALRAGEKADEAFEKRAHETKLEIKLIAPPSYVILTSTPSKKRGVDRLQAAVDAIKATIEEAGGTFLMKDEPRCVSEKDEKMLASLLATLERKNLEIDGDDENSDEDAD